MAVVRARIAAGVARLRTRRGRIVLAVSCVVLLAVGATLIVTALDDQHHAPMPPAAAALPLPTTAAPSTSATPTPVRRNTPPSPPTVPSGVGSDPVQITIPAIGVHAVVMLLGLNPDRSVQVPPLSKVTEAGWYRYSPTPGANGPSVILGHIDSAVYGKGVFYDLGDMRPGYTISVLRADHMTASFAVDRVVEAPKSAFPTGEVYGNTTNSQIRLITCGGPFDSSTRNYLDNIIVFGTLTSLKRT